MSEVKRLADLSAAVLEGEPWHAINIAVLLRTTTVEEATTRVVDGTHTIMEIVLHMTAWADEVCARLRGEPAGTPQVGDWPAPGRVSGTRWSEARRAVLMAYRDLQEALKHLPDAELDHPVIDPRADSGAGASKYLTVHGVIHHAVYHAGQIALLKRAIKSARAGSASTEVPAP